MCSVIIIVGSVPASALVGELTLGTGALLGIVITGLLASGVSIQASNNGGLEGAAQAILNNMTPQMQQRIAALKVTEVGGQLLVHWTAQTWREFTDYVKVNFISSGATTIPNAVVSVALPDSLPFAFGTKENWPYFVPFSDVVLSCYNGKYPVSYSPYLENNGWALRCTASVVISDLLTLNFFGGTSGRDYNSLSSVFYADTIICRNSTSQPILSLGHGYNSKLGYIGTWNDIKSVSRMDVTFSSFDYCGRNFTLNYSDGVRLTSNGVAAIVYAGTIAEFFGDILASGHMVGDFGAFPDVINPAGEVQEGDTVSVDVYPNEYVGDGTDSLPDVIPDGTSIAIPIPGEIVGGDTVIIPDIPGTLTDTIPQDIIKDVTIDTSIPDVAYPDMPELPDDGSEDNPDDKANKMRFPSVAKEKFPFCIPFDFFNAIQMLSAPAQVPEYDIPFVVPSINFRYNVHLDFSDFETVAKVLRWFLSAGWILTLILITKSIIK